MAIRFTPEYNEYINKVVQNYNKRVTRANTIGKIKKASLPDKVSVKKLKKTYATRKDLDRELKNLAMFRRKDARKVAGDSVNNYDVELINQNRKAAIKYFEKQAGYMRMKIGKNMPLSAGDLRAVELNIDLLRKGTKGASNADIMAMKAYVEKYRQSFERQATGYRGFLSEVDAVMTRVGVSKADRDSFFNKFTELDSEQFMDLYQRNDLINKIYQLADSPKYTGGKLVLHNTEEEARNLVETLMEEADILVAETKARFA